MWLSWRFAAAIHIHKLTQKQSRTVLFANDLKLEALTVIKYYALRFQTVRRCDRI